ncbi:larval cuticle protein 65Ag1-like [Cataglyphis hispanica]|uniref:larval cuticle protein 65Ag1-like n=1 Tax=Cataglyphis hispanica TaxID=1086592 RepID=UPI00217FD8CB|nr:larval cuticle protein 65Ag1-like [Cataglyphis hispanica]
MNRLAIILCILMEAVLIIAKTERLSADKSNTNKFVAFAGQAPHYLTSFTTTAQPSNKLYSYSYNIDGIQAEEDGHLNHINTEQEALEARGSYTYTDAEGNTFHVLYVANENGFQPEGAHLPKVPPLIKKALQYIAEHSEENGEQEEEH